MLELTKSERVEVWEVQAVIARKKYNHPFVALLMAAAEIEDEGEWITPELLHERLVPELPLAAVKNLLLRLAIFQLLHLEGSDEYSLTEIGRLGASDRSIWLEEQGIYQIGIVDSPFVPQRVVSVESVSVPQKGEDPKLENVPYSIKELISHELHLPNEEIQILDIEQKCHRLPDLGSRLTLEVDGKITKLKLVSQRPKLEYISRLDEYDESLIRSEFLTQRFGVSYVIDQALVSVEFDATDMNLLRDVEIVSPRLEGASFEKIKLPKIQFGPATQVAADKWLLNLSISRMDRYYVSGEDFAQFISGIAQEFKGPYHPKKIDRAQMIRSLAGNGKLFYRLAKVETINYLNY